MAYIGNDLQVAFPSYRIIDDISGSFNGVLKTFALNIGGTAPVPFPINPQQCLISVNGVVQKPDPSGATGFNLVGTNIVFASAPTAGWAFFGTVLAGADYVNVGANFPDGSVSAPSITFDADTNTGLYRVGADQIGITCGGVNVGTFTASGQAFPVGSVASPSITFAGDTNTGIYSPAADTIGFVEGGTEVVRIDSSGRLLVGTSTSDGGLNSRVQINGANQALHLHNGVANATSAVLTLSKSRNTSYGSFTIVSNNDVLGAIAFRGDDGTSYVTSGAEIRAEVDGTPGANDMPGRLVFSTTADGASSPTERMRIRADGSVRVSGTAEFGGNTGDGRLQARGIFNGSGTDTKDTGISVNAGNAGAAYLMLVTRNTSTGDNTQTALYFLRFRFDGNIGPTVTLVSGTNFITFGVSGSNTLTIASGSSGNWNAAAILVD